MLKFLFESLALSLSDGLDLVLTFSTKCRTPTTVIHVWPVDAGRAGIRANYSSLSN